jgi:hypothetical protein
VGYSSGEAKWVLNNSYTNHMTGGKKILGHIIKDHNSNSVITFRVGVRESYWDEALVIS